MTARRLITHFEGAADGPWHVVRMSTVAGSPLTSIDRLRIVDRDLDSTRRSAEWPLRGIASYGRYVTAVERRALESQQPSLGRPEATCAALIPITKSPAWWDMAQDERRAILEERSAHIATGRRYLPAIARRLYQSRDLGEPFDFVTWFEYAPADAQMFEDLTSQLRRTEEWQYVEREVQVDLVRT